MQRVFVLNQLKNPLMPCHPARARQLLKKGKAAIYRYYPFTIVLKERLKGRTQPLAVKIDPGSKISGFALVGDFKHGKRVIWAANIFHKGNFVRINLLKRRQVRRKRRSRKTRYRANRYLNRSFQKGWLPPSMKSRIGNLVTWVTRLCRWAQISSISVELSKFDTHKMVNPDVYGIEYQRGTLAGYEVREYLLEKWRYRCAYCQTDTESLEIDHVIPRSRGGSSRVSNLVLSCRKCNQTKGNQTATEFGYPQIQEEAHIHLKDAAVINITRLEIHQKMVETGLPIEIGTSAMTSFNRRTQQYSKEHWIDAACVGSSGRAVFVTNKIKPLKIVAKGRGTRQMCLMDRFGFPRTKPKIGKFVHGFQTGDIVRANKIQGQNQGFHLGRIAVRKQGTFRMGKIDGLRWTNCHLLQKADGFDYELT